MVNGTLAHSLDFDDTHAEGSIHSSAPIVPAALAAAEMTGASGKDLIAACVVGYEVQIRLSLALDPSAHYDRGYHPTATCGVFGAAAAAGKLLGLDADGLESAFGIALIQAAGSMQFLADGAWTKRSHVGQAAENGLQCAVLAAEGFQGPAEAFEGKWGFLHAYAPDADHAKATAGLGDTWQTLKLAVKPYPSCRYSHAALDGLIRLKDEYPREIADKLADLGLYGATISPNYGGLGLTATTYAKIVEKVSGVWMAVSGIFNSHLIMAAAVERFGSDAMKNAYLPRFASGELRGGIALTEPDCGTDLQAIRTRATREGSDYVITGTKMWITNSLEGGVLAVLAKTDPDAEPAHRGMSLFLVEKEAGYEGSKLNKLGYRSIDTAELVFDGVRVPAENLIGGEEGRGLQQILNGLELGRINVAARGVGLAQACLDESLAYAQTRKTFGKPICQHQAIQIKLADMATRTEAARLLVDKAARAYDEGRRCDLEAGMAKLFATEAAVENAMEAMRIHGAYGYSKEYNIERYYRDAPLLAIGEGTNELQRIIIAKQLVDRNPV